MLLRTQQTLRLNMAAAHLAARDYGACVAACGEVLAEDPACVTALLRRARAHMLRGDFQVGDSTGERWEFQLGAVRVRRGT